MRYICVLILVTLLSFSNISREFSQVFTGGNVGLHFEDGYYIDASLTIGYRYERLDVGLSPFFSYRKRQNFDAWYAYDMGLYDLMLDDHSPVEQPIVRGGVLCRF